MISVELLEQPSIEHRAIIASTTVSESSWMDPYISFLSDGSLPTDLKELEKVRRTSAHFWLEGANVLWAYRTTPKKSTSETPFSMTYGAEAVIPIEIHLSSMRVANFSRSNNDARIVRNLDSLEERRDMVSIQLTDYQQKLARGYNRNVKRREFVAGDLVLRKVVRNMKD